MSLFSEIVPGVFTWSQFSDEKQLNFNGTYVARNGYSVLVDPPELDAAGVRELADLISRNGDCPLRGILLTNVHHDRMSRELAKRFSVPVLIHEKDKDLLDFPADKTFTEGEIGFCGMQVVPLDHQKSPGESAFLLPEIRTLMVGDALIGKPSGKVCLLPAEKYGDVALAMEGLRALLHHDFDTLLVGDGECIPKDAKKVVAEFLQG